MAWTLLDGIPDEEVRRVLSIARRRTFARGEVVFHRDDPGDTVHLVVKGRFAVRIVTPLGDTVVLAILGAGDIFGELALVSETPVRTAGVSALEPAETRAVHRLDFDALRARHPETADVLIGLLAGQVRRLSERLVEALYVPADRRVLRRLCELSELYGDGDGDGTCPVEVPLKQEDIAALAGASRATTNRVLREAAGRGLVSLGRGRTSILDREGLARRAR